MAEKEAPGQARHREGRTKDKSHMTDRDFRGFLAVAERQGLLRWVSQQVDVSWVFDRQVGLIKGGGGG